MVSSISVVPAQLNNPQSTPADDFQPLPKVCGPGIVQLPGTQQAVLQPAHNEENARLFTQMAGFMGIIKGAPTNIRLMGMPPRGCISRSRPKNALCMKWLVPSIIISGGPFSKQLP